jgi:predicted dehydrogenase
VTGPRVGIVGARRRRQGLGPFVARDLVAAGAEVPCFLCTSSESNAEALRALTATAGIEPNGYLDLKEMLAKERLDAVAILSPAEHHADHLAAAAAAGVHVLCEKPFVWGGTDPVGTADALLERFAKKGLLVWENCQWPYTLPGYEALYPGGLAAPPARFEMELEPISRGLASLADTLPHALSLLQALLPGAEAAVEVPRFSSRYPAADSLTIRFRYQTESHACEVELRLAHRAEQPHHAGYALDGRSVRRVVSLPDYQLSFVAAGRSVPIADPLTSLVADFVAALAETPQGAAPPPTRRIRQRLQLLVAIATAYASEETR